jgi:hypothetical protein
MKIIEISQNKELRVAAADNNQTVLIDPETEIKTVVPKDPNKPGKIVRGDNGFELSTDQPGEVDKEIKPGDKVNIVDK